MCILLFFLECVSDADCNEANKNTCSGKMCICNSGFVLNGAACVLGMIKIFGIFKGCVLGWDWMGYGVWKISKFA